MRRSRRFIPNGWDPLENRQTLSPLAPMPEPGVRVRGEIRIAVPHGSPFHNIKPPRPVEALNREFASFRDDVQAAGTVLAQANASGPSIRSSESPTVGQNSFSESTYPSYINTRAQILTASLTGSISALPRSTRRIRVAGTPGRNSLSSRSDVTTVVTESADRLRQAVLAIPLPDGTTEDAARYDAAINDASTAILTQTIAQVRSVSKRPA